MAIALIAAPAFASVQNVKVSGDIDSSYLYRKNFDLGANTLGDEEQSLFFTIARLRVDADLTDNVAATIQLINERIWGRNLDDSTNNDYDVDINLAYVTLREMLYSPLTVIIGRQNFSYGNSLIIDSQGPNYNNWVNGDSGLVNAARDLTKQNSFDAIRAILDYNPLKIEMAFVELDPGDIGLTLQDNPERMYGINASYEFGDERDSMMEAYIWKKVDKSMGDTEANVKADTIIVKGLRGSTNLLDALNVQVEYAMQTGNKRMTTALYKKRRAHIVQIITNYALPIFEDYKPMLMYSFTKATGDESMSNTDEGHYTAWDPMYENQSKGKIYNAIFPLSNCVIHELTLTAVPVEDITASLAFTSLWLQRDFDANDQVGLLQPDDGSGISSSSLCTKTLNNTNLGKELDLKLLYDYTEDVQIGMNLGWFFPGSVFKIAESKNENVAKQLIINCLVKF